MDFDFINHDDLTLENGDFVMIDGIDAVRQRILDRLDTRKGEWAYDITLGLDYFGEIFVAAPDLSLIRSRILTLIATTPGVERVRFADVSFDGVTRRLSYEYVVLVRLTDDQFEETAGSGTVVEDESGLNLITPTIGAF